MGRRDSAPLTRLARQLQPVEATAVIGVFMVDRPRITALNQSHEFLELIDTLLEEEAPYRVTTLRLPGVSADEVAATAPQLIVADLTVERDNAYDLLRGLLSHPTLRKVPIILTTPSSRSASSPLSEFDDHPNVSSLPKPFTAEALEELVRRLLPAQE